MRIEVVRNFPDLSKIKLGSKEVWRDVGLQARDAIVKRTRSGRDKDGAAFRPYSQAYREQKQKELGKSSPVDLTVSGDMLNSLTITEVTEDSVTLGFTD